MIAMILATTMAIVLSACKRDTAPQRVQIGVILPLTGDDAVYGNALKNGIELARFEESTNTNPMIALIYEDDQGQAAQSVSAARKLIDVAKVPAIIGGAMSSTAEAIIPICNQAKVVLLSPTATKPSLTQMGQYFFRLWPSDNYDGKVMAGAAYKQMRLRRVGILYINTAYGAGIADVFEREFQRLGGNIVTKDGYKQGEIDFRTVLTRIRESNPDALYLPGYVAEISQILKQATELGLKVKFLGATGLKDPKLIEIAGQAAEGALFTYPAYDPTSTSPEIVRFVEAYRKKFKSVPDAFAAQGYDTAQVLLRVLAKEYVTRDSIRKGLLSLSGYVGPGGSVKFDEQGEVEKTLVLLTVKGGTFVPFDSKDSK